MADTKDGRDKKAQDAEKRQRERDLATELARGDEPEPPIDAADLADFESDPEALSFPATGPEIVAAVGAREIESVAGSHTIEELVPRTDAETFESPVAVRTRIQRPTIAAAMKRIAEANDTLPGSRDVRRQAAKYCRTNGYQVRDDEWLGI